MKPLADAALVGFGAALGGVSRHWLGTWIHDRFSASWPLGTLVINLSGSLLLGVVAGVLRGDDSKAGWQLFLGVGVLGGFTTFSAFGLQLFELIEERRIGTALGYAGGSVVLGVLLAAGGYWLGRQLAR